MDHAVLDRRAVVGSFLSKLNWSDVTGKVIAGIILAVIGTLAARLSPPGRAFATRAWHWLRTKVIRYREMVLLAALLLLTVALRQWAAILAVAMLFVVDRLLSKRQDERYRRMIAEQSSALSAFAKYPFCLMQGTWELTWKKEGQYSHSATVTIDEKGNCLVGSNLEFTLNKAIWDVKTNEISFDKNRLDGKTHQREILRVESLNVVPGHREGDESHQLTYTRKHREPFVPIIARIEVVNLR